MLIMTIMSYYFKIKTDKRKGENSNMKNDSKLVKFTAFVLLFIAKKAHKYFDKVLMPL